MIEGDRAEDDVTTLTETISLFAVAASMLHFFTGVEDPELLLDADEKH